MRKQKTENRKQKMSCGNCFLFSIHRSRGKESGFTLLIAMLVASVVLAIGSAIFSIALKQVTLSSIGRDSQYAFYTADSAAECALYWDFRDDLPHWGFATSSDSNSTNSLVGQQITCAGQVETVSDVQETGLPSPSAVTHFQYHPGGLGGRCADVYVNKTVGPSGNVQTLIHADGYSTQTCSTGLQRSVELRY